MSFSGLVMQGSWRQADRKRGSHGIAERNIPPPPKPRLFLIGKDTGGNSPPQGDSRGLEFHNGCCWAWAGPCGL